LEFSFAISALTLTVAEHSTNLKIQIHRAQDAKKTKGKELYPSPSSRSSREIYYYPLASRGGLAECGAV
jgi:hypothetical protein